MAKIDILLNLINFANDMLNESMHPTTSCSLIGTAPVILLMTTISKIL